MALFDTIRAGSSGATDFEVERSLRFNNDDSAYLNRTPSSAGNRRTMTLSLWVKGMVDGTYQIFDAHQNDSNRSRVFFADNGTIQFFHRPNDTTCTTSGIFRDPSAWYHIVFAFDTTQSSVSDRYKIYVNGVEQATDNNVPAQNTDLFFNSTNSHKIGVGGDDQGNENYFDGYMAEINFIDGLQLTPSSFGETDSTTGQWNPIDTSGLTFGTNGFRLKFADNSGTSATTLGKDSSGNGNNYTPNNFGTGDAVKDTPTNNFCTLSSINDSKAGTVSEANLRYTGGGGNGTIASTFGIRHADTQGYYFEARIISGNEANRLFVGIGYTSTNWISTDARGANDDSWVLRNGDGVFIHNSSVDGETTGAGALSVGDIIQIAVKGSKIWVGKNGSYFFSGNPSGDSTPKFSDIASTWTPVADVMTSNVVQFNFGQDSSFSNTVTAQGNTDANGNGDFYHSPPTGFLALCSKNLPDPTIKLPNQHFNTVLYTGNNSTNVITGVGFQPDWFWIKDRSTTGEDHHLFDAVRGINKALYSNGTDQETTGFDSPTSNNNITAVSSDGFTITGNGSDGEGNLTGRNYVAWNWNAGGSTATNNDGTITSQVRASTTAGFSIVSYTGNGSNSQTVGHGLGVSPNVVILKDRDSNSVTGRWTTIHSFDTSKNLELNTNSVAFGHQGFGSITALSSTTFTLFGSSNTNTVNESGDDYIAYVFSEVAGYSKFGSYTGNGSSDGTFVFTGFRPAWVMLKISNSTGNWIIHDAIRDGFNVRNEILIANTTDVESNNAVDIDIVSNGFKLRSSGGAHNGSGNTYIYLAFAESPFKYARAR